MHVVNYNHANTHNSGSNSNWNPLQSQQHNSYNNNWQRPNSNNYYRPYNRYPAGSQGWYASGGNYWHNKGQSLIPHAWLLILGILIFTICM